MAKLVPSLDLVRRTVRTEAAYTLSRLQVLERLPGNPVGVAYRRLEDGAVALMARHLPVPSFNSVVGLSEAHAPEVEALVAWYRDAGIKPRFELVPGLCEAKVGAELARLGLFQSSFHASLIGEAAVTTPAGDLAAIERVADAAALEEFLDAHAAGWQIPDPHGFRANVRGWLSPAGRFIWRASMVGRRRPPSSTSTTGSPIAPMRRPIPPSGAADCKPPCCAAASPTQLRRASTSCAAARPTCRPATATWSGSACACSSCAPCGRRGSGPPHLRIPRLPTAQ
jgi:hypothetical protein